LQDSAGVLILDTLSSGIRIHGRDRFILNKKLINFEN
jgi:hypothetical protein